MLKGESPTKKQPPKETPVVPEKPEHVTPKTSNPVEVAKTINQYNKQTQVNSREENAQFTGGDPGMMTMHREKMVKRKPANRQ